MGGLAWLQLRHRPTRFLALLLGLLVATSAFTVLTAASKTSQLRTIGTVSANFVPAYEILVRPVGARTTIETKTDTVQPNFLSGIYGGITMAQYHEISSIPGVSVAAPIAMIGYALLSAPITFPVPASYYSKSGRELFRVSTTWISDAGTSRVTQPSSFLYVTPNRLSFDNQSGSIDESVPGSGDTDVCPLVVPVAQGNPFGVASQSNADCWSKVNGSPPPFGTASETPTIYTAWVMPVLIAAIDPEAEAKLDGLDKAVVSGRYLSENDPDKAAPGIHRSSRCSHHLSPGWTDRGNRTSTAGIANRSVHDERELDDKGAEHPRPYACHSHDHRVAGISPAAQLHEPDQRAPERLIRVLVRRTGVL